MSLVKALLWLIWSIKYGCPFAGLPGCCAALSLYSEDFCCVACHSVVIGRLSSLSGLGRMSVLIGVCLIYQCLPLVIVRHTIVSQKQ